jgi:F-type H+-transporting ATPase subunit c
MKKIVSPRSAMVVAFLAVILVSAFAGPAAYAADGATEAPAPVWHYFGAAFGLGLIVIGAALGIGKFAAAAAEGIARQPAAAAQISGAVNLPLFLLEGVAIIAEVVVLLIVLLK